MKKILSMLLACMLVLSLLPAAVSATEQKDCVYLSVSFDGSYIDDQNGNPIAYVAIPLETIAAVDLTEYGLDNMLFDADGDGNYETTALQLLIYAHEELYGGSWSDVNFDALPGASYFAGGIFGFTENLVYFHNGDFPVDVSQESDYMTVGATSDRIVLEAGDFLDVASFSCYAFLWDQLGGFHMFADQGGSYVHDYTVTKGEALSVKLMHSFCDLMYGQSWVREATDYEVYYGAAFGEAEGSVVTDESGCAQITFDAPGTYYVWCDGGLGSDDGTHGGCDQYYETYMPCVVSAPAYARVTVTGGVHTHTEETVPGKPATCTATGLTEGKKCADCGEILQAQKELPALGHSWNAGVYTEPTCDADGYTTFTCGTCGETKVEIDEGSKLPEQVKNAITKQPEAVTAASGATVQFAVETTGDVVSYKWEYRKIWKWFNTTMEGHDTNTLTVPVNGNRNGYDYRCTVTFADGTVLVSDMAELTAVTEITDVVGPNDQTVVLGYKGQFTASAQGEGIKYQWQYKRPGSELWINTAMEGCTKPTVLIETTAARDGYQYRCEITDVTGNVVYTEPATMRVLSFKTHPAAASATVGSNVTFTVTTSVEEGFTYQWQYSRDGEKWFNTTMTGYNTDTLIVSATKARDGYRYRCVLTGSKNSKIESGAAVLTVS